MQRKRKERFAACLLLFISLLLPTVPVIPHHHHRGGVICMKHDVTDGCCHHHHASTDEADACGAGHSCCNTGCVATHFFQQQPESGLHEAFAPQEALLPFYLISLQQLLPPCKENGGKVPPVYRESLHDTRIPQATGLRAPPCA